MTASVVPGLAVTGSHVRRPEGSDGRCGPDGCATMGECEPGTRRRAAGRSEVAERDELTANPKAAEGTQGEASTDSSGARSVLGGSVSAFTGGELRPSRAGHDALKVAQGVRSRMSRDGNLGRRPGGAGGAFEVVGRRRVGHRGDESPTQTSPSTSSPWRSQTTRLRPAAHRWFGSERFRDRVDAGRGRPSERTIVAAGGGRPAGPAAVA